MIQASARTVIGLLLAVPRRSRASASSPENSAIVARRTASSSAARSLRGRASKRPGGTHAFSSNPGRGFASARPNANPLPGVEEKRSEEHTSELQSRFDLVCRLLLVNNKVAGEL